MIHAFSSIKRYLPLFLFTAVLSLSAIQFRLSAQRGACPDAPPLRLQVGGTGRMTTTPGEKPLPIRVHEVPGTSSKIVGSLLRGVEFRVLSGPECKDGFAWWQIVGQGVVGWIAEGSNDNYFVEPVEDAPISQDQLTLTPITIPTPTPSVNISTIPGAANSTGGFAPFQPGDVDTSGGIAPYQVNPDLSNVIFTEALTSAQVDYLERNAFVVSPGNATEFYQVYQQASQNYEPQFITTDSLLHSFHIAFDKVLRTTESQYFSPLLRDMNKTSLIEADKLYQSVKGTDWEDAARRAVAFIAVGSRLLDSSASIPDYVTDMVNTEIANITNAGGLGPSAIFPESDGEDWSQYIPRGHYTGNDALTAYFRAMMYNGRMTFRLSKPEETKTGLLVVAALKRANVSGKSGLDIWSAIYEPTAFIAGQSDNLTVKQYSQIMDGLYGPTADALTIGTKGITAFVTAAKALPAPQILNTVEQSGNPNGSPNSTDDARGLQVMGQRFVFDAYAFSQLIANYVGNQKKPRTLPMALDAFAALGSDRAMQITDKEGATTYDNYLQQINMLRQKTATIPAAQWDASLYSSWLYTLNLLSQPVTPGYPAFMGNQPYTDRMLYAALGSYTELKHDTILYAKQATSPVGASAPSQKGKAPTPVRPPNYVEPVPLIWARLAALAEMMQSGLTARGLLNPSDADLLKALADLARQLQKLSVKELHNQPLSDDEQKFLASYGITLEGILISAAEKTAGQNGTYSVDDQANSALIADIATDQTKGRVLQIGTGRIFDIYAIIPSNGKLYLARGGVFSYYEFSQPFSKRLTDESWQQIISDGKAPALPAWTFSFVSPDNADPIFIQLIRQFQATMVDGLWNNPADRYNQLRQSTGALDRYLALQFEPLAKARQYEGRQLIEITFRSIKPSTDGKTVDITVHETWQGQLYNGGTDVNSIGPKIGERGPYSIDIIYTFGKDKTSGVWSITSITANNTAPAWKNVTA